MSIPHNAEAAVLGRQITLARCAHQPKQLVAAAVDDLQKNCAARRHRWLWQEKEPVAGKLDQAECVSRSKGEISDCLIRRQLRVNREVHAGDYPFMRAGVVPTMHIDSMTSAGVQPFASQIINHQRFTNHNSQFATPTRPPPRTSPST